MVAPAVEGIDLFNIAGRSISGWVPSFKMGTKAPVKHPFCSQLEERLLLRLEYHPLVASYARGDIGPQFAATYRLPTPRHAPFTIDYLFKGKLHEHLPDVIGTLTSGKPFIAEAGMEDDKRSEKRLYTGLEKGSTDGNSPQIHEPLTNNFSRGYHSIACGSDFQRATSGAWEWFPDGHWEGIWLTCRIGHSTAKAHTCSCVTCELVFCKRKCEKADDLAFS